MTLLRGVQSMSFSSDLEVFAVLQNVRKLMSDPLSDELLIIKAE